jgi:choline dehydrogenase-like flavoprotein
VKIPTSTCSCSSRARATASSRFGFRPRSPKLYGSAVDWSYRTTPQEHLDGRAIYFPRGKTLGGSSSINAQMVLRGHRADQDSWQAPGWGSADVEEAYHRSEPLFPREQLRDPSPLSVAFVESAAAVGHARSTDLNGPDNEGVGLVPVSQRRGRRWSVADGYLRSAMRRPNLTVITNAHARRLVFEGRRALGVTYRADGRDQDALAGREVILSGGAINSPQLLLLSGVGPRAQLEQVGIDVAHDLPGVGRNLRDHIANGVFCRTRDAATLFSAESFRHLARWLLRRRGPLCSNVGEAAAFIRTRPELQGPDLELIFLPVLFVDEGLSKPPEDGLTIAAVALQPGSVGEVRLGSPDPNTLPSSIRATCPTQTMHACSSRASTTLAGSRPRSRSLGTWSRSSSRVRERARTTSCSHTCGRSRRRSTTPWARVGSVPTSWPSSTPSCGCGDSSGFALSTPR